MAIGVMMTNLLFHLLLVRHRRCTHLRMHVKTYIFNIAGRSVFFVPRLRFVDSDSQVDKVPHLVLQTVKCLFPRLHAPLQPVLRRMTHQQAPSEVGSGRAPGGECGGAERRCWAITAVLIFCHIVSQQGGTLSGKGTCKSTPTHPRPPPPHKVVPTAICIDKGRRAFATEPIF